MDDHELQALSGRAQGLRTYPRMEVCATYLIRVSSEGITREYSPAIILYLQTFGGYQGKISGEIFIPALTNRIRERVFRL